MNNQISVIKFKGILELLKEDWKIYCSKIKTLLGIMIVLVGFELLSKYLTQFLNSIPFRYSIFFSFYLAAISLISFFLGWLVIPTIIYAIKENIGIKEFFKKGLKIFPSFFWVFVLLNLIIVGGLLLFVVPGIVFSIWFSLAIFVLVFEGKKGMNALFRSQNLNSGKFWGVLRRFIGFGLIILLLLILILAPIFFLPNISKSKAENIGEFIGYLLELFVFPFALIYGCLIYENLEKIKKEVPFKEPSKKRKLKYLLPAILGSLIFILMISFNFLNIFLGRDEMPPYDADLQLSKIEIPKEENVLFHLTPYLNNFDREMLLKFWPEIKEAKEMYWPKEKEELIKEIIENKKWDENLVKELIEKNEQVFNDFEKAVKSPYFQDPIFQDPKSIGPVTFLISLRPVRNIASLNLIRASYLFKENHQKEAFDQTIKIIKMGQLMEDSPRNSLIHYLMGMAIKEEGFEKLRKMLPETNLSPEILKDYIREIEKFEASKKGLKNIFKMEYASFINSKAKIDAALTGKLSKEELKEMELEEISFPAKMMPNYLYKPNQTQRLFIENFRTAIENVDKNYNQMKFIEFEPFYPRSKIKMLFTENVIGKTLRDIIMISYQGIFKRKCEENFSARATQLLLALRAYQLEKGKIPTTLDELVPEYISKIPKDPFDGKPIRYLAEKKIIYSVGSNLKDEGGSEGEDWRKMPDPTLKIEF